MSRNITYLSWGLVLTCILTSIMTSVEAADKASIKWPSTMLVQEGSSSSILSSGVAQPLEAGLRDIGIDMSTSYQILDKRGNNYYYARYGEGTLLYGFGPQKDSWHPTTVPVESKYTLSMIQDYEAYVQEHPETFTLVAPFRETRKNIYVGEIIVNTWFKQVEYPMYVQIAFLADSTGAPRLRYIVTHVKDDMLRKQLQYVL
ncbi:hypothetical protein [Veillonella sp. CHU732]|uniref:hypothetical protein n=1 Tax=Veillonella sp. CHU732 TaxID=2490949 RepID=UPI000F8CBB6B|nr:hypothetical protein [Veillonella sp. CHU732]